MLTAARGFGHWAGQREARAGGGGETRSELEQATARPGRPATRLCL